MKTKNLYSTIILVLIFCHAQGQVSLGPQIGINFSNFSGDIEHSKFRVRTQFGGLLNFDIGNILSIQPGLLITGKGATLDMGEDDKDAITVTYLEIPVDLTFNFATESGKFQIIAGPYLAFSLNANYKYLSDENNEKESLNIGTKDNDDIKPADLGFNVGIGYRFKSFQVHAMYEGSFTNVSPVKDVKLRNNTISLTFAYLFGL